MKARQRATAVVVPCSVPCVDVHGGRVLDDEGAPSEQAATEKREGALTPLRSRKFRLLFLARGVSTFGSFIAPTAIAFAILNLTGSTTALGVTLAARTIPQVVFLLAGGIWSDRLPRHRVMVASSLVMGVAQALSALLLLLEVAQL